MIVDVVNAGSSKAPSKPVLAPIIASLRPKEDQIHYYELRAQSLEPMKVIQQLSSGQISIPPLRPTPIYSNSDTSSRQEITLHLNNAIRNDLKDLHEAADIRCKLGQFKKYCDSLCLLGEWDRALAIAPAIGLDYWQSLMKRYVKRVRNDPELSQRAEYQSALVPYLLASDDISGAVDQMLSLNDLDGAYLLASVDEKGGYNTSGAAATSVISFDGLNDPLSRQSLLDRLPPRSLPPVSMANSRNPTPTPFSPSNTEKRANLMSKVASAGFDQQQMHVLGTASPSASAVKLSAAWKLVVDDVESALNLLVSGGELDHALGIASVFDLIDEKRRILELIDASRRLTSY